MILTRDITMKAPPTTTKAHITTITINHNSFEVVGDYFVFIVQTNIPPVIVGGKDEKLAGWKARERGNSASISVVGDQ